MLRIPDEVGYEWAGNMTSEWRWNYTWDAENRLIKVESLPSTPQGSWRKVEWTYDAKGRRIRQKSWLWTNSTWIVVEDLKFISDPMSVGRHILELNGSNNAVVRSYVWGLDLPGTLDGAGGVGGLLWVTINSGPAAGTHFAAYDGNGNVVGLISASTGAETARYEYGPFAEPIRVSGPVARPNPFRFSTKRTDDTTDLLLYEYRAYSPSLGRWPNRDPIAEYGGANLYGFVGNDPIRGIDPLGLLFWGCSRNPCADPCGDAKRNGLDKDHVGGVVCCEGKKYSCVWISGGSTGAKSKKAKQIIDTCVREHEDTHHDDIDCPPERRVSRPPYKPGKDPNTEECTAYKATLACLENLLKECGVDPQCIAEVQAEIHVVRERIKAYCGL